MWRQTLCLQSLSVQGWLDADWLHAGSTDAKQLDCPAVPTTQIHHETVRPAQHGNDIKFHNNCCPCSMSHSHIITHKFDLGIIQVITAFAELSVCFAAILLPSCVSEQCLQQHCTMVPVSTWDSVPPPTLEKHIHTYIHTDRQTDRQTNRQTDGRTTNLPL